VPGHGDAVLGAGQRADTASSFGRTPPGGGPPAAGPPYGTRRGRRTGRGGTPGYGTAI